MVARTRPTAVPRPKPEKSSAWVSVLCSNCGRKICEASPGSAVKIVCKRCKKEVVSQVA